jgi:hypothetical protein
MSESQDHPAALDEDALLKQCDLRTGRVSGPGGQHRNKTDSAVWLTHRPTGVHGSASERRSQHENLRMASFRLRVNLALEARCPVDPLKPASAMWKRRLRRDGRIELNPEHRDFPAMLAEALDMLAATDFDPARAAATMGCSTSQFIKLLKHDPRALARLNQQRAGKGLRGFR